MPLLDLVPSAWSIVRFGLVAVFTFAVLRLRYRVRRPLDEATLATDYLPVGELWKSRLLVYVPRSHLRGEPPETVVVAGFYGGTDEFHAVEDVPFRPLSDWNDERIAIQNAFPQMSLADRYFIGTGGKWIPYPDE